MGFGSRSLTSPHPHSLGGGALVHAAPILLDARTEELLTRMNFGVANDAVDDVIRGANYALSTSQPFGPALDNLKPQASPSRPVTHKEALAEGSHRKSSTAPPNTFTGPSSSQQPPKLQVRPPSAYDLLSPEGVAAYKRDRGISTLVGDNEYRRERWRQRALRDPSIRDKEAARKNAFEMRQKGLDPDGNPLPPDAGTKKRNATTGKSVTVHLGQFADIRDYWKAYHAQRSQDPDYRGQRAAWMRESRKKERLARLGTSKYDPIMLAEKKKRNRSKSTTARPEKLQKSSQPSPLGHPGSEADLSVVASPLPQAHSLSSPLSLQEPLVLNVLQVAPPPSPRTGFAPRLPRLASSDREWLEYARDYLLDGSP